MISVNDFKNGLTIQVDGELWRVVEFQHVKPGKGSAFVRSKLNKHKSTARRCNIFMPMATTMSSWIQKHMNNLNYQVHGFKTN